MTPRRIRELCAALVATALVATIVAAAVRADAPTTTRAETNDGGAWLVRQADGVVGHVNRAVGEISGVLRIADAGARFDVEQSNGVLVTHDRSAGTISVIDQRTFQTVNVIELPREIASDTEVTALDHGIVVRTTNPLRVWLVERDALAVTAHLDEVTPVVTREHAGRVTTTAAGGVAIVDEPGATVLRIEPDATAWRTGVVDPDDAGIALVALGDDAPSEAGSGPITSVGERLVYTHGPTIVFADAHTTPVAAALPVAELVLQQPAADHRSVIGVDPDGVVVGVDVPGDDDVDGPDGDGPAATVVPVADTESADHLSPIVHDGCIFTVGTAPPTFSRICGGEIDQTVPLEGVDPSALRLRLVNGWIWVNDLNGGAIWVASSDTDLERIDDWGTALGRSGDDPDVEESSSDDDDLDGSENNPDIGEIRPQRINEDGINNPPVARDVEARTRVDLPVVIDVLANDVDPDGDALMVTEITDVPDGVVVATTADQQSVQVIPPAGSTAPIRFGYTVSDGRGGTDSANVDLDVVPADAPNRPPVAVTDIAEVRAGATASFNVLDNDYDPDGDAIVLTDVRAPAGRAIFDPSGEITYTPDPSATAGTVELEYDVADSFGEQTTGMVRVAIRLDTSNNRPNAVNDTAATAVGTPVTLNALANDTDPDGDPLIVSGPPRLVAPELDDDDMARIMDRVSLSPDGEFFFLPEQPGDHVFLYTITDGSEQDSAYIRVRVDDPEVNRPPVAVRDDVTIPRGETRNVYVLENDFDPDGDVLGIVSWTDGDGLEIEQLHNVGFRVTALPDAPSETTFRYSISDGVNEPSSADVVVAVSDASIPDQPPVARPDIVEVRPGRTAAARVLLNDYDPEGGPLRVVDVSSVPGAQLRIGPGGQEVFVSVDDDVTSSFTFTYDVADEAGNISGSFVQVRIVPPDQPNRPPVARPDVARTVAGRAIDIPVLINDSDPDGDAIMLESIAAQPLHGTAEVQPSGEVRYTPSGTFGGTDRFRYTIVDTYGDRAVGEVVVGVLPPDGENRPPTAVNDNYTVIAGSDTVVLDVLANDFDPDGDPLRITDVSTSSAGVELDEDDNVVRFSPPESIEGAARSEAFTYTIDDGRGGTDTAIATIEVVTARQPMAPVAVDDLVGPVRAGAPVSVNVLENDFDPDGRVADLGVVSLDERFEIGPDGEFTTDGLDETTEFAYEITDPDGLSDTAIVTIIVLENVAPEVEPLTVETEFETPVTIDVAAQATDLDGDTLSFLCCEGERSGGVTIDESGDDELVVTFTPDDGFSGEAGFSYVVDDQEGHLVAGAVTVIVAPQENSPPTASDASVEVEAGTTGPISLTPFVDDPDLVSGDVLTYSLGDTGGAPVSLGGSTVTASPPIDAAGSVYLVDYVVTDAAGESDGARLTIEVTESNVPPPTAISDEARTTQGSPVTVAVLANDIDPLGQGLTVVGANVTDGSGSAAVQGDTVVFTPDPDYFGVATFTYEIEDARGTSGGRAIGTATVTVIGLPGTPSTPTAIAGNATASVTWTLPPANGAPITDVELEVDGAGVTGPLDLDATTGYTFDDLVNGESYRFRVRALNEAGWGPWSEWSQSVTPDTRPDRPSAPVASFDDGQLSVTWSEPTNEGSALTGYELEIGGGSSEVRALGTSTDYTWDGLENGTTYQFRVVAVNAAGRSDPSAWSDPEHPLRSPDAPGSPDVTRGNRSLDLDWSSANPNGDPVIEYRVELRSDPGRYVPVGTATSYRWANLPNGVEQQFRVQARNRDPQWSDWSSWSEPVKPCTVPDRPSSPSAQRGDRQAVVTYDVPGDQGCAITEMQIRASDGTTQATSSSPHTFGGLTNGSSYSFEVRARNEEGWGDWSPASNGVTPAGTPIGPASINSSNHAPGTVDLTWPAADPNGSAISRYEVRANSGAARDAGTGTSYRWSGLSNSTRYTFQVRACNDVGCGSWSPGSSTTTWGTPSQVGTPNASAGNRTVTANWSAPAANGSPITEYQVNLDPGNTTNQTGTSRTWNNLNNGTQYRVQVRARNAVGWGPWSNWSQRVTPEAPPPPESIRISKGRNAQPESGCSHSSCRWIDITASGLPANTQFNLQCNASNGRFGGGRTVTSNGSGSFSLNDVCFFGYPGETVWIDVTPGGRRSNTITW